MPTNPSDMLERGTLRLIIVPASLAQANAFVARYHRHHIPTVGHRYSLAVVDETGQVRGVAIVGRPVARMSDDGLTLECTRCCTDGCANACSALYGAAWRVGRALGYQRMLTHTLIEEAGTSLRAAGWRDVGEAGGGSWERIGRTSIDKHPLGLKRRWEVTTGAVLPEVRWPETESLQMAMEV